MSRFPKLTRLFVVLVVCAATVVLALLLPLPVWMLRPIARASSNWIVSDYMASDASIASRIPRVDRKVTATWLRFELARKVARQIRFSEATGDVERLVAALHHIKPLFLTNTLVDHQPAGWPVLVSGVGWCDQINGAAAEILVHHFDRADVFAMLDERGQSPHAVGRVWSNETADWLYYDIFFEQTCVFRLESGSVELLHPTAASAPDFDFDNARRFYSMVAAGDALNSYRRSFGAYLAGKVVQAYSAGRLDALATHEGSNAVTADGIVARNTVPGASRGRSGSGGRAEEGSAAEHASGQGPAAGDGMPTGRIRHLYVEARLHHLFGECESARAIYRKLSRECGGECRDVLLRAAGVFVKELRCEVQSDIP